MAIGAARSVCRDAPQRGCIRHWLNAHGRRGHGVHSPYLYAMCRAVFTPRRRRPDWVDEKMPRGLWRVACEASRLCEWSGAAKLMVPKGWAVNGAERIEVVGGRACELIEAGEIGRRERWVVVMPVEEWMRLPESAWRTLVHYFDEGSWFMLMDVRDDEASWQRWRWFSESPVFSVSVDCWRYGMVVYRAGMPRYSFGVR